MNKESLKKVLTFVVDLIKLVIAVFLGTNL